MLEGICLPQIDKNSGIVPHSEYKKLSKRESKTLFSSFFSEMVKSKLCFMWKNKHCNFLPDAYNRGTTQKYECIRTAHIPALRRNFRGRNTNMKCKRFVALAAAAPLSASPRWQAAVRLRLRPAVSTATAGSTAASAAGDKVVKIGVFEPSTGDSASGGKKEMLGMQYANSETPTVEIGGETYQVELVYADNGSSTDKAPSAAARAGEPGRVPGAGLLWFGRVHCRRPRL